MFVRQQNMCRRHSHRRHSGTHDMHQERQRRSMDSSHERVLGRLRPGSSCLEWWVGCGLKECWIQQAVCLEMPRDVDQMGVELSNSISAGRMRYQHQAEGRVTSCVVVVGRNSGRSTYWCEGEKPLWSLIMEFIFCHSFMILASPFKCYFDRNH